MGFLKTLGKMGNPFSKHSRIKIFAAVKVNLGSISAGYTAPPEGAIKTVRAVKLAS